MRNISMVAGAVLVLMTASCGGGGSTEQEINQSLENILRSVSGDWTGTVNAPNAMRVDFHLQEGGNGQLSGSGTMQVAGAAAVPVTVTGTWQRPVLTLAFEGMVYESRLVQGVLHGTYTTVGGVSTTLTLTAPGYVRDLPILLQEK